MIDPIAFETGGSAMPLFPSTDVGGLKPLELPPFPTGPAHPADGAQARPAPSSESVARFQAALGEPPARQPSAPPPLHESGAIAPPRTSAPVAGADTASAPPIQIPSAPTATSAPSRRRDVPAPATGSPLHGDPPVQRPPAPTPLHDPAADADTAPAIPSTIPSALIATPVPPRCLDVPAPATGSPLPGDSPVRQPPTPSAPQEAVTIASPQETVPVADAPFPQKIPAPPQKIPAPSSPPVPPLPRDNVASTIEPPVVQLTASAPLPATPPPMTGPSDVQAGPPVGGEQPLVDIQRPMSGMQPPKAPVALTKPRADGHIDGESTNPVPQLQAAPVAVPVTSADTAPTTAAAPVAIEIDPAASTARTRELVEAANQVADTILVTPSLVHGEGEITIRLKQTVLDGSEIRLEAKGAAILVAITPTTPSAAQAITQAKVQFEQTLAERIPSFQVTVSVESLDLKASRRKDSTV